MKRYHIKDDVWLVRVGRYTPDYEVQVAGEKVADLYFWRGVDKRGAQVDCHITFPTSVRISDFASYFKGVMKFLRNRDWSLPAPNSVEEYRAQAQGL